MTTSLQSLLELATMAIQKLSREEKAEFRQAWRGPIADKIGTAKSDRRFLRSAGIDPDGDCGPGTIPAPVVECRGAKFY